MLDPLVDRSGDAIEVGITRPAAPQDIPALIGRKPRGHLVLCLDYNLYFARDKR